MAKIRNVSGDDLVVPWLGGRLVAADEVVDVDPVLGPAYLCQEATWRAEDADAQALSALEVDVAPPRNASTDIWRAWSALQPGVAPDEVADASREELISAYGASDPEPPTSPPSASDDAAAPASASSPFGMRTGV